MVGPCECHVEVGWAAGGPEPVGEEAKFHFFTLPGSHFLLASDLLPEGLIGNLDSSQGWEPLDPILASGTGPGHLPTLLWVQPDAFWCAAGKPGIIVTMSGSPLAKSVGGLAGDSCDFRQQPRAAS